MRSKSAKVGVIFLGLVILLMSVQCAKRQVQGQPSVDKIVIDKKDLLAMVDKDLQINQEEAEKARFQTERIMVGDRLQLSIYEKLPVSPEKREEVKRVNEEGKIFLLPLGELKLAGLRIAEAEAMIEERFSDLVVSPHCEIQILEKQYAPRVYVYGEVLKAGTMDYKPGDRLLDALSKAGGCADKAYKRSIKVIRTEEEHVKVYSIDLRDIFETGNVYNNLRLQDQDIVFVPRRFLTGFNEVFGALSKVMPTFALIQGLYLLTQ